MREICGDGEGTVAGEGGGVLVEAPADGGYGAVIILLLEEDGVLQHRESDWSPCLFLWHAEGAQPGRGEEEEEETMEGEGEKEEVGIAVIACAAHSISSQSRPYMAIHMCSTPTSSFIIYL